MSASAPETSSIAVRLRDALAALPRGERSVARTLLNAYPIAGLGTLAELAARSGVSTPTVLRLLSRLGFEGYSDFQRALHIELSERLANVYEDYRGDAFDERSIGAASLAHAATTLEATAKALTEEELGSAVRLLADPRLTVYAMGGAFSQPLALLLTLHLTVLRSRVQCLPHGSAEQVAALAQSGRRDVLVVYDFRRYSEAVLAVARHVAGRGGRIVLLTDRWLSPVAPFAESVLVARTESVSPFDSLTAATALTEALVAGVSALLGTDGRARAEAIAGLDDAIAREPRAGSLGTGRGGGR
jgi:DNA-binding MurR/RpiR family transcriptional regulator